MASAIKTAPKRRLTLRKGILTFLTIGAVGAVGAFASTAALSDDVAFLAAEAHGGTLAIEQTASSSFGITGVENLVPYNKPGGIGGWKTSTITVQNTGSVSGNATVTVGGEATPGCFEYYLAESNSANGWHPVATNAGNQWGGPDVNGERTFTLGQMDAGDKRSFKLALRMDGDCTVGSGLNSGGVADLDSRHDDHAKAKVTLSFNIQQLQQS